MDNRALKSIDVTARIFLAGIFGGSLLVFSMFYTFYLIGLGFQNNGILLNPTLQSEKLIIVWTKMEPLPLAISNPILFSGGMILFSLIHAIAYHYVSPPWPHSIKSRTLRLFLLIYFLSFVFVEFYTPFSMLGEPVTMLGIELFFWLICAWIESLGIVFIYETLPALDELV